MPRICWTRAVSTIGVSTVIRMVVISWEKGESGYAIFA
jgi:hypothetical protein